MEKLRQHYRKVEKQDIPASQTAFEKQWQQWGASGLAALRVQLLKREEELRRKEQEDTERSRAERRAEQLRKNDNAVMDSGVLSAVVTGYGEAPMPGNGEMTCYLLLHNRNGEYTLWGNELEKYRTRIFERVDLMRDRSGYICDRSEIGQHPPLQRVYSSATFEQLLTQVCQTWPQYTRNLRQPKTWPESFCLGEDRQPAMPSLAARKVDFTQGRLLPTLMPVMSSVDRETRQLQLLLVMGVDDSLGGVVRLNGTLYPAFAVPSADNSQLVISALTDKGLRYAGYGVAVNHDAVTRGGVSRHGQVGSEAERGEQADDARDVEHHDASRLTDGVAQGACARVGKCRHVIDFALSSAGSMSAEALGTGEGEHLAVVGEAVGQFPGFPLSGARGEACADETIQDGL